MVLQRLVEAHDGYKNVSAVSVSGGTRIIGFYDELERHSHAVRNAEIQFSHALNAARKILKEVEPELLDPKLGWPAKWHHVDDVIAVLRQARAGKWAWCSTILRKRIPKVGPEDSWRSTANEIWFQPYFWYRIPESF